MVIILYGNSEIVAHLRSDDPSKHYFYCYDSLKKFFFFFNIIDIVILKTFFKRA